MIARRKVDTFEVLNYVFFSAVLIAMLYPFWHVLVGSFVTQGEYYRKLLFLWPSEPTLNNYRIIVTEGNIIPPLVNTASITVVGTTVSLMFTAYLSFGLSRRFPGVTVVMQLIVLTMIIQPGIIPNYLLMKELGLLNNRLVYILPSLAFPFHIVIMRTYFRSLPDELEDASRIDGCSEFGHFFRIVLPISKPILATIGLFLAVMYWNTFFPSLFYISSVSKKTLQEYLYRIVTEDISEFFAEDRYFTDTVKLANIIVVTAPILMVYPFVQKYFVKGIMLGSVKG